MLLYFPGQQRKLGGIVYVMLKKRKGEMEMRRKKLTACMVIAALLVSMMPQSVFAAVNPQEPATYAEGAVLKGSDGETYQFPPSEQGYIKIRYIDTATGKWKVFDGQYESGEPKRTYVIRQNGESYRGYCIEHGVRVDGTKRLTAEEQSELIYAGLSQRELVNLQLALFYGYQSGDTQEDLYQQGFRESAWFGEHSDAYNWADWYIATQCLVWEIQQGNRSESMARQTNSLGVSGGHYLSMLSGRPAVDIYNWMVSSVRNHMKFPSAINSQSASKPKKLELKKTEENSEEYSCTFKDTTDLGGDYIVETLDGTPAEHAEIRYNESKKTYTIQFCKKPGEDIYRIQHASRGKAPEKNLLFWGWKSDTSHLQTIVTGAADPVAAYVQFTAGEEVSNPEEPDEHEKPEPDWFPEFRFSVSKEDQNPGWDGNSHTGMGDAPLSATYTLYRSINGGPEEYVDSITLDELGNPDSLYDRPWLESSDFIENSFDFREHMKEEGGEKHCEIEPVKTQWTAEVTYRLTESPPEGRLLDPDSGERYFTARYSAVTEDQRSCMDEPENWSEIQYTISWDGNIVSGAGGDMEAILDFGEVVFINDCFRGRLFLTKSNESEDVFEEEGSSGVQTISRCSRWKMYLKSGGWENHPCLRFEEEGLDSSGTRIYRVVRDTSGKDNAAEEMQVGTNGCIYIYDIPYGNYRMEETAADDASYVLESFDQMIGSEDVVHQWNIRNKKKENIIKVIKTDGETGKQVRLKGTKFYLRYMGNPLLDNPETSENYGRLLPNGPDINSDSGSFTFVCDENGEIVISYDLEYGQYQLEEWAVPEGYWIGERGGNCYTFQVSDQDSHLDGNEYTKYYQAVSMKNQPVKGKIKIEKYGEMLTGFLETIKDGFSVKVPQYTQEKLKGAVFGIYAAEDIDLNDGVFLPEVYDCANGSRIDMPIVSYSHSGNHAESNLTEIREVVYETGASVRYTRQRNQSESNQEELIYKVPAGAVSEPQVYFKGRDGVETRAVLEDGFTTVKIRVPISALRTGFEPILPAFSYGTQNLDWYSSLTPDNPETEIELSDGSSLSAKRIDGLNQEVCYEIRLRVSQLEAWAESRPFVIAYGDGYEAEVFRNEKNDGTPVELLMFYGTGNTIRYPASVLVETAVSGEKGEALSAELPLGRYLVRELSAPGGYLSDSSKSMPAELMYKDQFTSLVWDTAVFENRAVPVELELKKVFETGYQTEQYMPGDGAVFGIFNMEEIRYTEDGEEKILESGTCLDTVSADKDGSAVIQSRLPEGMYYVKELKTRYGYVPDEKKYCFQVKDSSLDDSVWLSKTAEGYDEDGISIKITMKEHGIAEAAVELLTRYPERKVQVNRAAHTEVYEEKDRCRYFVTASEEEPAELILPDGKPLAVTVNRSGFSYTWGEEIGEYIPCITWTGYSSTCTVQPDSDAVLYSADGTKRISVIRRELESGSETECTLYSGSEILEKVILKTGETWEKKCESSIFQAELSDGGSLRMEVSGTVEGHLEEEEKPSLYVDGTRSDHMIETVLCSTLARQDSESSVIPVKINTADGYGVEPIRNSADQPGWTPEKPETPEVPEEPEGENPPEEPEQPEKPEPLEEPEDVPKEDFEERVPKTGDSHQVGSYVILLLLSVAGLIIGRKEARQ